MAEIAACAAAGGRARVAKLRASGKLSKVNRHAALMRWGYYRWVRGKLVPTPKGRLLEALRARQTAKARKARLRKRRTSCAA